MGGTWTYSDAERAYWTEKQGGVGEPLAYGYAGGWSDVLACLGFFAFAMVAVCIALTPVFSGEYQDRTDAVLLSSRYGRSKLVAAKIVAALAFATGGVMSAAAGYAGMHVATRANTRTAHAAEQSVAKALNVSFKSGLTMGLCVASFALLGLSLWLLLLVFLSLIHI